MRVLSLTLLVMLAEAQDLSPRNVSTPSNDTQIFDLNALLSLELEPVKIIGTLAAIRVLDLVIDAIRNKFTTEEVKIKKERTAFLVLSYYNEKNTPMITDIEGRSDSGLAERFSIETGTELVGSCSVNFRNEYYVYGGHSQRTQISKISSCSLKTIGQLPFNHYIGDCSVSNGKVYLCFNVDDKDDYKRCRFSSEPKFEEFTTIRKSYYDHKYGSIGSNDSKLISEFRYYKNFSPYSCSCWR